MSFVRKTAFFLAFVLLLNGCQTITQPVDNSAASSSVNHSVSYEAPKGRLTPEISIARALKYNLDNVKNQVSPKFIGKEAQNNAFKNLQKMRESQNNGLASALKELDFAILYTTLNFSTQQDQIDNILTQATAQNIVLATLKAHETALYSHKKLFEYNRLKRQYQNQIASIIKKKQNTSEEEIAYQKQLEENIDKLTSYYQSAEQNIFDFYQLAKIENTKTEPEGRNFYEKNKFLPQYNIESYVKSAYENREDIKLFPSYSFEEISLSLANQDIDISPAVNGFYISDKAVEKKFSTNGSLQAANLLKTIKNYQKTKNNNHLAKLSEEFHKAVYWQLQIAYQLAKHTADDYDIQQQNLQQLKNDIRKLEKTSKITPQQRLDLLKARSVLLENEIIADQVFAERTMTYVALQFYSGLSYINLNNLNQDTETLAAAILKELQTKTPSMSKTSQKNTSSQNWAHHENWLEDLISEQQKPTATQLMSKTTQEKTIDYNKNSTMILGSFLDVATADKEWLEMKKLCPELEQYTPMYEKTSAAGITLFRLTVKYPTGGFKNVCICLRNYSKECFLQD